jgi:hypothetical protein
LRVATLYRTADLGNFDHSQNRDSLRAPRDGSDLHPSDSA